MLPRQFGKYLLTEILGSGGFATVYKAEATDGCTAVPPGRHVAVKVIHARAFKAEANFKRFIQEAETGMRVRHPNVVRTLDVGFVAEGNSGSHYIVMDLVDGRSLREILEEGPLSVEECCRIGSQVAAGLAAIHELGAVHRDVKPANIMIERNGTARLMDLGIAKTKEDFLRRSPTEGFIGTLLYAAPEQIGMKSAELDGRADLYSLGLTMYEMCTCRHPFHTGDVFQTLRAMMSGCPPRALPENVRSTPFFDAVLLHLLARHRHQRFATGAELAETLGAREASDWWEIQRTNTPRSPAPTWRELARMLIWPFRRPAGVVFLGGLTLLLIVQYCSWAIGQVPVIGPWARALLAVPVCAYALVHARNAILASLERSPRHPPLPVLADWQKIIADGVGLLAATAVLFTPAIVTGSLGLQGPTILGLALLGWACCPAVLLVGALRGTVLRLTVPSVAGVIRGTAQTYVVALMPFGVAMGLWFLAGPSSPVLPVLEVLLFVTLVFSAHATGRAVALRPRVTDIACGTSDQVPIEPDETGDEHSG